MNYSFVACLCMIELIANICVETIIICEYHICLNVSFVMCSSQIETTAPMMFSNREEYLNSLVAANKAGMLC